jgi:hypothetical protein
MGRMNSDEAYILDLCDQVLGLVSLRQHRFDFLRGDTGRKLPVDAYYRELGLVIEYHEKQHSENVSFFDNKPTVSGVSRRIQRQIYDERRVKVLPCFNIDLMVLSYLDFDHTKRKKLARNEDADRTLLQKRLMQHPKVLRLLGAAI